MNFIIDSECHVDVSNNYFLHDVNINFIVFNNKDDFNSSSHVRDIKSYQNKLDSAYGCQDKLIKLIYELTENNDSITGVNSFSESDDNFDIYLTDISVIAEYMSIVVYVKKYYVIEKQNLNLYSLK